MPTPKTKANQKRLDSALAAFHARYSSPDQYGQPRWDEALVPALFQPTGFVALVNSFVPRAGVLDMFQTAGIPPHELRPITFPPSIKLPSQAEDQDDRQDQETSTRIICFERLATMEEQHEDVIQNSQRRGSLPFPAPSGMAMSMSSGAPRLLSHWNMDAASILAASLLDVQPGDHVLDLCSAPGGKSIVLAQLLFPSLYAKSSPPAASPSGDILSRTCLHCNEPDLQRNKRLSANLQSYLPASLFTSKTIQVLQLDASVRTAVSALPLGEQSYDKVLVDAPCSSERHILHAHAKAAAAGLIADEIINWKPAHSTALSKTQLGILTNALLATRIGGKIVYATCALGKEENDLVVEAALNNAKKERKREKASGKSKRWAWDLEFAMGHESGSIDSGYPLLEDKTEPTQYGRIALPDKGGWGPLYFSIIHKTERKKRRKGDNVGENPAPAQEAAGAEYAPNLVEGAREVSSS